MQLDIIEAIGYIGSLLLIFCGIPQLVELIRTEKIQGLSLPFFIMWSSGELFLLIYVTTRKWDVPLFLNYLFCLIISSACVYLILKKSK